MYSLIYIYIYTYLFNACLLFIVKATEIFQNYVSLNIILKSGVMDNN